MTLTSLLLVHTSLSLALWITYTCAMAFHSKSKNSNGSGENSFYTDEYPTTDFDYNVKELPEIETFYTNGQCGGLVQSARNFGSIVYIPPKLQQILKPKQIQDIGMTAKFSVQGQGQGQGESQGFSNESCIWKLSLLNTPPSSLQNSTPTQELKIKLTLRDAKKSLEQVSLSFGYFSKADPKSLIWRNFRNQSRTRNGRHSSSEERTVEIPADEVHIKITEISNLAKKQSGPKLKEIVLNYQYQIVKESNSKSL